MKRLLIVILLCFMPSMTLGLSPEYKASLIKECNYMLWKHPHVYYKWDTEGGVHVYDQNWGDCSSTIYAIAHQVGIPVTRVAAIDIEAGRGGWKNKVYKLEDAEETTLVFWTWINPETGSKSRRLHGHIGLFLVSPKSKLLEVMHNSQSKGLHLEPIRGQLLTDISSIKHLTIGEKQPIKLGPGVQQLK